MNPNESFNIDTICESSAGAEAHTFMVWPDDGYLILSKPVEYKGKNYPICVADVSGRLLSSRKEYYFEPHNGLIALFENIQDFIDNENQLIFEGNHHTDTGADGSLDEGYDLIIDAGNNIHDVVVAPDDYEWEAR